MSASSGDEHSVVVPATSANVGCAFDCAALAVTLYLRVSVARSSALEISYRGPAASEVPLNDSNLIVKAMRHFAASASRDLPPARIAIENEIPLGVGLGSSAAAIVAGIALGSELCGEHLAPTDMLRLAFELEHHPDNIAAAVHGGMVVSTVAEEPQANDSTQSGAILIAKTNVSQKLDFVVVVPDVPLPTEQARAVLPQLYSRADVVANLQRTALMTAAFFSGKDFSPELFRDRLHQPYRAPLVPGIAGCLAFRHEGLAGIFLSGSGSSVMAIARHSAAEIGEALVAEFRSKGKEAAALLLKAENRGVQLSRPGITTRAL